MTFTDLSDFNRGCGYTPAEFNPFENDYSRTYARELMKKGAAVSVVRINNDGKAAEFNIDGTDTNRSAANFDTVCKAAMHGISKNDLVTQKDVEVTITSAGTYTITTTIQVDGNSKTIPGQIIPGTLKVVFNNITYIDNGNGEIVNKDNSTIKLGDIVYKTGVISNAAALTLNSKIILSYNCVKCYPSGGSLTPAEEQEVYYKYTFCPQIQGIVAKYPGSFGNNLFISISQINTNRLAESYQYANISVYYIDRDINYQYNPTTHKSEVVSQTVKSVTMLETKRVSTNPNDPNYFEDVEFEFIKVVGTPTAREDLALVWSNISGGPTTDLRYSGFPVIPLRYVTGSGLNSYNFDSNFNKVFGTDFNYSNDLIEKLKSGFKGFIPGTSSTSYNWTQTDVNEYLNQVYGGNNLPGIYSNTLANLSNMYQNYTDPYIYDFDFITSGGFVYQEYTVTNIGEAEKVTNPTVEDNSITLNPAKVVAGTLKITTKLSATGPVVTFTTTPDSVVGQEKIQYTDYYGNKTDLGTIVLETGVISITSTTVVFDTSTVITYRSTAEGEDVISVAELTYPSTDPAEYTDVNPIHAAMINLVETRQDCIALFDVPYNYDKKAIVEYSRILNTSYGTMHFPWCWVADPDVQGNMLLMAPSYIFMYTFLSNLDNNVDSQKWFPPAGVKRATARVVKKPYFEIGSVVLNDWQNDNTARVNPIMKLKQYGYVIYGQYTCLPAIDMFTHSALESLNVRLIANVVKKKIFDVCLNLAFEPNTSVLWLKFFAQMDEFLRYMQYNEGVYAYKIVMDESTVTTDDINHLRCPGKVYIAPTRTAEFFDIDFIITEAGALFNN